MNQPTAATAAHSCTPRQCPPRQRLRSSRQKRQDGSAFALTYRLLLRSCKLMGAFVISPLPPLLLEPLQTAGLFALRALLRFLATTDLADSLSSSTDFPVLPVILFPCLADFATGRGGFLQLLSMTLSPCCPFQPRRSVSQLQSFATLHAAFSARKVRARLSYAKDFPGHERVHLRYGPVTRSQSMNMALSIGFRIFSFLPSCYSSYWVFHLTQWD